MAVGVIGCFSACGGLSTDDGISIAFRRHPLRCEGGTACEPILELEAEVQISDLPEACRLQVLPDRRVQGVCRGVPSGGERTLRLVYYSEQNAIRVELATAVATVDLSGSQPSVSVEFATPHLNTSFDDDGDAMTNLCEFCIGRDPLVPDS